MKSSPQQENVVDTADEADHRKVTPEGGSWATASDGAHAGRSGWRSGRGALSAGLIAVGAAVTALLAAYWVIPPDGTRIGHAADAAALAIFTAIGVMSLIAELYRRKRRKQAETELQRYMQELERSNAELQDFALIAAHDLQEPLRKVTAFGDHLREHLGQDLDELGNDYLTRMQNATQRMSGLIEALLQYSRVTTRAQAFQPVDPTQVVFGVLVDMEEVIAQTHARVECVPLPKVMADPIQVRQLLQNLIANALKFQRPGTMPEVVIAGRQTDTGWREISVRDTGIGFDEKHLDRIFRPFQRLHGRGEYAGSGMGLAICRKVVARHGGTITARSRPGEGSTFIVTLPAAPRITEERGPTWETEAEAS